MKRIFWPAPGRSGRVWRVLALAWVPVLVLALSPGARAGEEPHQHKSSGPVVVLPPVAGPSGDALPWGSLHLPGREYRSGTGWWALACSGRCALAPLKLEVSVAPHPQYDGEPVPGQRLRFSPAPPPGTLLLFKPFRVPADRLQLQAGPVVSWHPGVPSALRRATRTPATMEGELLLPSGEWLQFVPLLLQPDPPPREAETESRPASLALELRLGGRRQIIAQLAMDAVEGPRSLKPADYVVWVGDLDGDGRPDLLVNAGDFARHLVLLLSSLAGPDELVGPAGQFLLAPIDQAGC